MVVFDTEQAKGLLILKQFVIENPTFSNKGGIINMIDGALEEGCYSDKTRKKLNQIRNVWFNQTHAGSYKCRYCLQDTSQVDYDYLSGTDHLECQLKHEMEQ